MALYLSPWISMCLYHRFIKFNWPTTPQPELQKKPFTAALVLADRSSWVPPCLLLKSWGLLSSLVLRSWQNNPTLRSASNCRTPRQSLIFYAMLILGLCSHTANFAVSIALSEESPYLGQAFKSPEDRGLDIYCLFHTAQPDLEGSIL